MNPEAPAIRRESEVDPKDRAMVVYYEREIACYKASLAACANPVTRVGFVQHIAELQLRRLQHLRRTF